MELHHGGKFTKFTDIIYVDGQVRCIYLLDIDEFSIHEIDTIMVEICYVDTPVICYHIRIPHSGLDFILRDFGE